MGISKEVARTIREQSWIRQMFNLGLALKAEVGEDRVFDLSIGNPVAEPPSEFYEELLRLAEHPLASRHRYMPNAGYPEVRATIAAQLETDTGLPFTANEVVMTCGAAGGLNVLLKSILDPADEVVIFAPYFPEYPFYIRNHLGVPKVADCDERFQPDLAALEGVINERTKAVLVNSPNNPSGAVYAAPLLRKLGELLARAERRFATQIFLISDESYAQIIYDDATFPFIFACHPSSIAVTSYSKSLSVPGERIGYVAVNPSCAGRAELADAMASCTRVLGFVNAPALMQHLVSRLQLARADVARYRRNRDYLYRELADLGYTMVRPQGAFYLFPRSPLPDDIAFVREMQQHYVLVVPGSSFGVPGHFRISYSVEERVLSGAVEGFARFAKQFGLQSEHTGRSP